MIYMTPFIFGIFICAFFVYAIIAYKTYQVQAVKLFFQFIFYIYTLSVIKFTLLPLPIENTFIDMYRTDDNSFWVNYNFIPFSDLGKSFFLNIILFVPYGFGIKYITKKGNIFMHAVLAGTCIETMQAIISLLIGANYRSIDINDIMANGFGVIIGYMLWCSCLDVVFSLHDRNNVWLHGCFTHGEFGC